MPNFEGVPVTPLKEPTGAYVLNLSAFPLGAKNAIERIANCQAGIYVWYKYLNYSKDPTTFGQQLLADCSSPKFAPREGEIKPYFKVRIGSSGGVSLSKREAILNRLQSPIFREKLACSLTQISLFQCPLYIGKSIDLKERIRQHLSEGSPLRSRLSEHSINISNTLLLIIPLEHEENEDLSDEDLYEEIFSRLLNPLFTLRIG